VDQAQAVKVVMARTTAASALAVLEGQASRRRDSSVRVTPRAMEALKKRKCQEADTLSQAVKKWRIVSGGPGGRQRGQFGEGATRQWCLLAVTSSKL